MVDGMLKCKFIKKSSETPIYAMYLLIDKSIRKNVKFQINLLNGYQI